MPSRPEVVCLCRSCCQSLPDGACLRHKRGGTDTATTCNEMDETGGLRPYNLPMPATEHRTWILTASPENHAATREHDFGVIGIKERNRARALQIEPGDRIVLYLTKVMAFAGSILVTGDMYEDRTKIWPGKPGKADAYPWRFPTEPEIVLEDDDWVSAEELATKLEHIRKWPPEHWKLAFQGQLRTVSGADAKLLVKRMRAAARAHA
jgi:hypothetical protein